MNSALLKFHGCKRTEKGPKTLIFLGRGGFLWWLLQVLLLGGLGQSD